jgi:Flp pilus assembly protein TadG
MRLAASGLRRGNAMLEFALSATILSSAFAGIFQFGYSLYVYNELEGAIRGGVRYASLLKLSNAGNATTPTSFSDAVKNMVVYGTPSPADGQTPIAPGLSTGIVSVVVSFDPTTKVPIYVTVSISSLTVDAVFRTFTFTGKPTLKMPYFGQYCSAGPSC